MKRKAALVNKRTLSFALLSLLLLVAGVPNASMHDAPFPTGFNSASMEIDTIVQPESLDPAWANDNISREVIFNAYETLIFFDPLWSLGPYQPPPPAPQRNESFVPQIASALPTVDHARRVNPKSDLPVYSRFTFPIRTDVQFHSGGTLTPRDVEYSIERVLVQDRTDGPAWRLYEPLLGVHEAKTPGEDPDWGIKIDGTVEVDGGNVQFNLAVPYPDMSFMQTLCQTWASVLSESWAVNEGDLNMAEVPPIPPSTNPWSNWKYIYNKWHDPTLSFLEDAIDKLDPGKDGGTGPYRMSYWNRDATWSTWSIRKFDPYRNGWPAPVPGSIAPLGGYLDTVTWYWVENWLTRLAGLLAGIRDTTDVPWANRDEVLGQVVGGEPIRCYGRYFEQAWMRGWYYNPLYTGEYAYHRWKARTHFGDASWDGLVEGTDISVISMHWTEDPLGPGPGGFNPRADINGGIGVTTGEVTGLIRGIPDGKVDILDKLLVDRYWDSPPGPLHPGGGSTQPAPEITTSVYPQENMGSIGETFTVSLTVTPVNNLLGYTYILLYNRTVLTAIASANLAYLVDPQFTIVTVNFINYDEGYVYISCYTSNSTGFTTTETKPLVSITFQVDAGGTSALDIDENQTRLIDIGARAWVHPYNLKVNDGKLIRIPGDVNNDGVVDMIDLAGISAHWYPGPPIGPLGYDPDFDINGDGAIDMLEVSIISAYWTGPPKGPSAP